MSSFNPSKYQQAIFNFIQNGQGNAVINAVAGSGKTTTIVEALKLIPSDQTIYFLAFNKAIVEELTKRVPNYVNVMTLHSLGAKALYKARQSKLNDKKAFDVVADMRESWYQEDPELVDADYIARVRRIVDLSRANLATSMADMQILAEKHGLDCVNGEITKAADVLTVMAADLDTHDFTDMLYIPATDNSIKLPIADWIFVDECQDLNKAQQMLIRKMMKAGTRFIAVGDPHQAIYGFAGADADSFNQLRAFPNTIELPLSYNYRCGWSIIKTVNEILPHITIEAHEGAQEGTVNFTDSYRNIDDGDMVLCRNTVPLVSLCMTFIKMHRKAYVKGGDMGKQLANMVVRSKAKTLDQFEMWLAKELEIVYNRLKKARPKMTHAELLDEGAYRTMAEKKGVFEAIIDSADLRDPQDLIFWINDLFSDKKSGVCFSSCHRAKGLEANRVFIIDIQLMPSKWARQTWQMEQEENLMYVAFTRAKQHLGVVEDWHYKNRNN